MLPRGLLLVCLVAVAVAAPNLLGDFVLDDKEAILGSGCVDGSLGWGELFTRNFWCQPPHGETVDAWRPWPVLWWRLAWGMGGGASWPFHLLSLLLHAGVSCALVLVARAFGMREVFALALGCGFAAAPIHVDAIGWSVGQAELWGAAFALLALGAMRRGAWGPALASLALGLVCKESVLMIVPALWLVEPEGGEAVAQRRRRRIGLALVGASYLLIRSQVLGELSAAHNSITGNPLILESWSGRVAHTPAIWGRYVATTLIGAPLSADWSHDALALQSGVDLHYTLVGALAAGLMAFWAFRGWSHPGVRTAALILGAYALLLGQVLTPLPVTYAERLFYMPSAALLWLLVHAVEQRFEDGPPRALMALGLVIVLGHTVLAMRQSYNWTTEDRIVAATLEVAPQSARARVWAAWISAEAGDAEAVGEHAAVAAGLQPDWPLPHALMAFSHDRLGEPELAAQSCGRAMSLDAGAPLAASLCIQFLVGRGKLEMARQVYAQHAAARGGLPSNQVAPPP